MRLRLLSTLLLVISSAAQAQNAADPDKSAAQGAEPRPAGWETRYDRPNANAAQLRFVNMGAGMHVTTGPAAIHWSAKNAVTGPFTAEVSYTQMKAPTHPEAYGLIWAGKNLADDAQDYMYFIIRGDGKYMVKHRAGAETHEIVPWTDHAAINKQDAAGKATNALKVEAGAGATKLYVNGQLVKEIAKQGMTLNTDGIVGLRVNHNLDLHIAGFAVKK